MDNKRQLGVKAYIRIERILGVRVWGKNRLGNIKITVE